MMNAQPDTVMVEGHGRPDAMTYRVTWLDWQGHVHQRNNLGYGEAWILADKLQHEEAA